MARRSRTMMLIAGPARRRSPRRRGRGHRRNKRGAAGKGGFFGWLKRAADRPVSTMAKGLGLAAIAEPAFEPDGQNQTAAGYLISGIQGAIDPTKGDPKSLQWVIPAYIGGVKKGNWIGPAVAAVVLAWIGKKTHT